MSVLRKDRGKVGNKDKHDNNVIYDIDIENDKSSDNSDENNNKFPKRNSDSSNENDNSKVDENTTSDVDEVGKGNYGNGKKREREKKKQ